MLFCHSLSPICVFKSLDRFNYFVLTAQTVNFYQVHHIPFPVFPLENPTLLHFCFPFRFQCFILYSIYTDLDLTLTWGKDNLRVAEKAIYSCSAAAAVFWKMNRIRLCLITFHIT